MNNNNINPINQIFEKHCTYENINAIGDVKMRNRSDGLDLLNAVLFRINYCQIDVTQEDVINKINRENNTFFKRNSYTEKEDNIPVEIYKNIAKDLFDYYKSQTYDPDKQKHLSLAVDGCCSLRKKNNVEDDYEMISSMGYYDATNLIPVDLRQAVETYQEIKEFKKYITANIPADDKYVFICDRAYHCNELIDFLDKAGYLFIIRGKGDCDNLDRNKNKDKKFTNILKRLRKKIRIVRKMHTQEKELISNRRNDKNTYTYDIKSEYTYITNLTDTKKFPDSKIFEMYKERWSVELFFKFIKRNFKFRLLPDNEKNNKKTYYCEMILTCLLQIIKHFYMFEHNIVTVGNDKDYTIKINDSLLMREMFDYLLKDVVKSKLNRETLMDFCKHSIKIVKNKKDRKCPRKSKTPYTKWSVQGKLNTCKIYKAILAIINETIDELSKNIKNLADRMSNVKVVNIDE